MERVALKLLEREDIHDPDGACRRIDHVLHGQSLCHVNQVNKYKDTVLIYACKQNMKSIALKLLEREDIKINYTYIGKSALYYPIENNIKSVINRINEINKINYCVLFKNKLYISL